VDIYVKISLISTFSLFLVVSHDFIILYIDFTRITVSNTTSDDSQIRSHIEYLTQTYYMFVLFYSQNGRKYIA